MMLNRRTAIAGGSSFLTHGMAMKSVLPIRDLARSAGTVIDGMVHDHGFQGVVMLGQGGKPLFSRAVGFADIARKIEVAADTPFGIASISKRLTAVAVMRLVEYRRLDLDVPIATYLPDYRPDTGARVTLRHLLSNSSGVPNLFRPAIRADPSLVAAEMPAAEAIRRFASGDLAFEPGTQFDYAPTNWFIIQGIVEAVTGLDYARAMDRLIVEPLGLTATTLNPPQQAAKSYRSVSPVTEWLDNRPAYRSATGGYFSTARDLLRFAHQVYDTNFLLPTSRSALTTVKVASASYALGGRIRQVPVQNTTTVAAWETGNLAGYRAVLGHCLDGRGSVVVLNNTAISQPIMDEFAESFLRLLV